MQMESTNAGQGFGIHIWFQAGASDIRINSCYLRGTTNNSYRGGGVFIDDAQADVTITNSILLCRSTLNSDGNCALRVNNGTVSKLYNTWCDGSVGRAGLYIGGSGTVSAAYNCAFRSAVDDVDVDGTLTAIDYCAADDDLDTEFSVSNCVQPSGSDWDNEYTDITNGDYTPVASGNIENAGIGPGSDANVPTTDMSGETRSGTTCDIGPNEITGAAQSPVALILQQH